MLFFHIYVNNPRFLPLYTISFKYADETFLLLTHVNYNQVVYLFQEDIDVLLNWS